MTIKDLEHYPKHSATGTGISILSNRISFFYNLHGPSLTLDTACSSSLVGFHLAHQSILNGEADTAIAVGSALHFDPNFFLTMTDMKFLSPDGRCRAFDANGRGYARGEGICAVILRRNDLAETSGNHVRAAICGSAINHDGYKEGLTMPNAKAQESLMANLYKRMGLPTDETSYFEAHGTGTPAGDPKEMGAIGKVFASSRTRPLHVGSVKTNIGHLEGASGLAGIIKTTLSLEAGKILPNMHFNTPNPQIDFKNWKVTVPTKVLDWEPVHGIRRASINSFGYGGSNAHIVLQAVKKDVEQLQPSDAFAFETGRPFLLPLTSHNEKAGKKFSEKLAAFMQSTADVSATNLCRSISDRGRTLHAHRSFIIGSDHSSIVGELQDSGRQWTRLGEAKSRIGFIFTGQGAQWFAMGRQLIEMNSFFRQTLERCDRILQSLPNKPDWSCITELLKPKETSRVNEFVMSSPLCCTIQIAIVDLLAQWGITPAAVAGHSSGEIPAAYAAGVLTFEDALISAYQRGYVLQMDVEGKSTVSGAMIAVGMTEEDAVRELEPFKGRACVAAANSYSTLTLSGDEEAIVELQRSLEKRQIFVRRLQVERAFHSHHMIPYASVLARLTNDVKPRKASCRMISSVTGQPLKGPEMTGTYFAANLTGKVRFAEALTEMLFNDAGEQDVDVLLEIGAHPALKGPSRHTVQSLKLDVPYVATLDRGLPAFNSLLGCAGQLFVQGIPVDLGAVNSTISIDPDGSVVKKPAGQKIPLPSYAWDHGKYWSETRLTKNHRLRKYRHPILGIQLPASTQQSPRWRRLLRFSELSWLPHHKIEGTVVFPAAGYLTMALEAALRLETCPKDVRSIGLRDVMIKSALTLSEKDSGTEVLCELQPVPLSAKRASDNWQSFSILSFSADGACVEHCHGLVGTERGIANATPEDASLTSLKDLRKRTHRSQRVYKYYKHLDSIGLQYGEAFQLISGMVESGSGFAMAPLTVKEYQDDCLLHPTFLDAALHPLFAGLENSLGKPLDEPFVPTFLKSMEVSGNFLSQSISEGPRNFWVCAETSLPGPRLATNDISIRSEDGSQELIAVKGLEATALGTNTIEDGQRRSLFFRTRWQPAFDYLDGEEHSDMGLPQLMDIYAHQFPNSRILHITSEGSAIEEALQHLGGQGGKRRRFQSLTPYSSIAADEWTHIGSQWPGLIDLTTPVVGEFDVVVISEQFIPEVIDFLKPEGVVISDGIDCQHLGLTELFDTGRLSAWQKPNDFKFSGLPLTLITSQDCSDDTEELVSSITTGYHGVVDRLTLADLPAQGLHPGNVIVLTSLDEDLPFTNANGKEVTNFAALSVLFQNMKRNIMWVTKGALMEAANPEQAMIIGLARTARNENEKLKIIQFDAAKDADPDDIAIHIGQIISKPLGEEEFASRNGVLYIPRVEADDVLNAKLFANSERKTNLHPWGCAPLLSLKIGSPGLLETLVFSSDDKIMQSALADDEVEIEVKASAISSRDVAAASGQIDDHNLGDECAGIILRTGSRVKEFAAGDRVVAWRPGQGAHANIVRNPASLCHKIGSLPFATATSIPLVLTAAYYALGDLARLESDETILIHGAARNVGQMALQLADLIGANVIATCGSQAERDLLKNTYGLSDEQILSSQDSSFVGGVRKLTNGNGVDVVLNNLTGNLLHASWSCVARFGRFVEIGKRDIYENGKLDMEQFRNNVSFHSLDMATIFELRKPLGARLLRDSMKLVEEHKIKPPESILKMSYDEVEKAFRLLQSGKYTGKIVFVAHKEDMVPVSLPKFSNAQLFDSQKTYLIVGGLGGLGRTLAEWMMRRGARSLAFMSRSGKSSASAIETISWLNARDVEARVFSADVTDYAAVKGCIEQLRPQLAGIFHAAMVLQDSPLDSMTHEQWQTCVLPKVIGAQNLHRATLHLTLDFFIPFSSTSATIGALAQANYAAANTYLDALVCHRRGLGLNASTMNIGMIKGAGVVDRNDALEKIMLGLGLDPVTEDELLYQVQEAVEAAGGPAYDERMMCRYQTATGINLARKDYYWSKNYLFRNLYSNHDVHGSVADPKARGSLTQMLQNAQDAPSRHAILLSAFLDKISTVLGISKEIIQPSNPLTAYGLDSIVAVELRKWFSGTVHADLALFDILNARSITVLIEKAVTALAMELTAMEPTAPAVPKVEEKLKLVISTPVDRSQESAPGERLAQRWQEADRAIKVPSVQVEVVELDDEDGPS